MDRELIDRAWRVLPAEFKEEVKNQFRDGFNDDRNAIGRLFWVDNLLSDAEEEEMLTVPRKKVQEKWQRAYEQEEKYSRAQDSPVAREKLYYNRGIMSVIDTLFGTKCLPDEACNVASSDVASSEIKPAEPKFKVGDRVRIKDGYYKEELHGCIGIIRKIDGCHIYVEIDSTIYPATIHSIEPYTEPKENVNHRQFIAKCDKQFDNILKDSFSKERRLNIAAMAMQGYLSSNGSGDPNEIAHYALAVADALIKASEEGGEK